MTQLTENGLYEDLKPESCFFKPTISIKEYPLWLKPGDAYSKHQQSVYEEIRKHEDNPRKNRQAAYTLAYDMIWVL